MSKDIRKHCVGPDATIREALAAIDVGAVQVAVVLDDEGRLLATVTDGDIRRGLLRGLGLADSVQAVMNRNPMSVPASAGRSAARRLMREKSLHHVPMLDDSGRLVDLAWIDEIVGLTPNDTRVVLMAGGLGQRLRPLTERVPKPMLMVGDRPLLETIIGTFTDQGFGRFTISVNYLADVIKDHFGDGSRHGIQIDYIDETERMGTAGALSLMKDWPDGPFVVMNGDLLTTTNFESVLRFHAETNASATMCAREFTMQVPYGVIQTDGTRLVGIEEKPNQGYFVNAGIYVLSPHVVEHLQPGAALDMPDLFKSIVQKGDIASVYPVREYWMDIGRIEDLERASAEFRTVFAR